jgi:hypothetical protein
MRFSPGTHPHLQDPSQSQESCGKFQFQMENEGLTRPHLQDEALVANGAAATPWSGHDHVVYPDFG